MAESLDNAEIIGGVAVEIGIKDDKLRAAPAQVKQIAKQIEQTPITVRIVPDVSRLNVATTQLQALSRQAQQVVNSVQVTISPSVNGQLAQQQFTALVRQLQSQANRANIQLQAQFGIGGGSGSLNNAVTDMQTAANTMQAAATTMELAANTMAAGGGGGGGGNGGGRRGGGGRAGANPFTLRGLGALTGSVAAVYAVDIGAKLATELIQAQRVSGDYQSILQQHSSYAYDPANSGGAIETAKAIARDNGSLARIAAVESIPIIGTADSLFDAITGTSDQVRKNNADRQQSLKAQVVAKENYAKDNQQYLRDTTGRSLQAVQEEDKLAIEEKKNIRLDAGKFNGNTADADADLELQQKINKLKELKATAEDAAKDLIELNRPLIALTESRALAAEGRGDRIGALRAAQEIEEKNLQARQAEEAARYVGTPQAAAVASAQATELENLKQRNNNQLAALEKQLNAQLTAIDNEGAAERIRISAGEHAAKEAQLQATIAAQIAAATGFREKMAVITAGASKLYANFVDNVRAVSADTQETKSVIKSAELRIAGDQQAARLNDYRAETEAQLEQAKERFGITSPQYRNVLARRGAGEAELIADQNRSNEAQTASIEARIQANNLRIANKPEQASILERNAAGIAAVKAASPEMRAEVAKGVLSELAEERHQLTVGNGPGSVGVFQADALFQARPGLNDALKQIDDDEKKVRLARDHPKTVNAPNLSWLGPSFASGSGSDPALTTTNQLLQKIVEALNPTNLRSQSGGTFQ